MSRSHGDESIWRYSVRDDAAGCPRWWLHTAGGELVAHAAEGFETSYLAKRSAENFKANAALWTYETYADGDDGFRWRAKAITGEVVAISGKSFDDEERAQRAANAAWTSARRAAGP